MTFDKGNSRSITAKICITVGTLGGALLGGFLNSTHGVGHDTREMIMLSLCMLYGIRLAYDVFFFMIRKINWFEGAYVTFGFGAMNFTFVTGAGGYIGAIGLVDWLGVILFAGGSWINFKAGLDRTKFKKDPANKGKLYTSGLSKYTMHANYFGDALSYVGMAMVAHNYIGWAIAIGLLVNFVALQIPLQHRHMAKKYGRDYREYAKKTAKLVPWVY